jgi:NAD(P)-dependent dehydrogenase (short-subunit alcohol dehydrogenase family)
VNHTFFWIVDFFTETKHRDTYPEIDPVIKSDCKGKSILVTGASKGIGKAVVISYAKAGASRIALATRSDASDVVADVIAAATSVGLPEPTVLQVRIDVSDTSSTKLAAEHVKSEWGQLDILINNSGYMASYASLLDTDDEVYMQAWDVNFWGAYRVTKAFLPLMLEGGDKTVIFMSSVGIQYVAAGGSAYCISKLAVTRLAEFLDQEYSSQVRRYAEFRRLHLEYRNDVYALIRAYLHTLSTLVA